MHHCSLLGVTVMGLLSSLAYAVDPELIIVEPPSGYSSVSVWGCNGSGLIAAGSAYTSATTSVTHAAYLYRTGTGTIATAVFAPPPGYSNCSFNAVNDAGSVFFGWVRDANSHDKPAYYDSQGWHVMSTTSAGVRVRGCNPEGTMFFGSLHDGSRYRAAVFNSVTGNVGFLPSLATDGDTIIESEASGGIFTQDSIIAWGMGLGAAGGKRQPMQFGIIPPFIFAAKLPNPSASVPTSYVVCSQNGSRLAVNSAIPSGNPLNWTDNGRFAITASDPIAYTKVVPDYDDPAVQVTCISGDGQVYAGLAEFSAETATPIVGRDAKYHRLWNLLTDKGVTIPGHSRAWPRAANGEGNRFWGSFEYTTGASARTFYASVDVPLAPVDCAADFNKDGFITFEDFDAFVEAFEAGC